MRLSMTAPRKSAPSRNGTVAAPDPEVTPKRTRRTYTAKQKLAVLLETDQLDAGQIGSYLRQKGLYWSLLTKWRKQRDEGQLTALEPKKRGTPAAPPEARLLSKLEAENERLRAKLEQAEKIIDVQKKLCELFGLPTAEQS